MHWHLPRFNGWLIQESRNLQGESWEYKVKITKKLDSVHPAAQTAYRRYRISLQWFPLCHEVIPFFLLFPVTVLVLMIIACSCCCYSCCSCNEGPDHRRRKAQIRPTAHPWSASRGDITHHQGHAWTLWFSPMGMTLCTNALEMAITILMIMTQRTRNHSMKYILSVTATAGLHDVSRKVTQLYHNCLHVWGGLGVHRHQLLTKQTHLPNNSPAAGLAKGSICEHQATHQSREYESCHVDREHLLSSQVPNPEGWCWVLAKPLTSLGCWHAQYILDQAQTCSLKSHVQ